MEVDGEIHEGESERLIQLESEYDTDALVPYAEAMLGSSDWPVWTVTMTRRNTCSSVICSMPTRHLGRGDVEQAEEKASPEQEAKASTKDEAVEPFDPTANLPDSTRDSSSTVKPTCGSEILTFATVTPKPSTTYPCRLSETP
ncbi:MAG: hypothetical protein CM15mP18_1350 [Methanobacteriota archaeon]|nr:MAG: hypothetical protein CM15mP18_1350 [Euryarchaeota archaeon]